jgi:putative ABC transport system ATP-binding protein
MHANDRRQFGKSVFGCGAACALIHDLIWIPARIENFLKIIGVGLAFRKAMASGDAVTEANKDRPLGGRERPSHEQQTACDENHAPGVHVSSLRATGAIEERSATSRLHCEWGESELIQVKGAKKWIQNGARRVDILKGISLDIPARQFVAIVGASGSGKSTLLGLLAGLDTPSEGEIWLDGVPIHNLAETELAVVRGRKIGFVFQSYQLIQTLTALENVLLPYELNLEGSGLAQARRLLDEVGLRERMDHYPIQLSGGEQQRVALARAFVTEPPVVMADEPTGNLDTVNGKLVLDLLLDRNRRAGTTLVLVTHDPEIASCADRKIVLRDGLIVEDTNPASIRAAAPAQEGAPWPSTR